EAFTVDISNADRDGTALTITDASGEGDIVDDELAPTVAISDGAPDPAVEGTDGTITFTVTLSGQTDKEATVDFTAVNGTALAGATGTGRAVAGTGSRLAPRPLPFAPAETTTTVTAPVLQPAALPVPEAFTVGISNADRDGTALTITDDSGTGNIVDDEPAPT